MNTLLLVAAAAAVVTLLFFVVVSFRALRQEVTGTVSAFGTAQRQDLEAIRARVEKLTESNEVRIDAVQRTVDERLREIQAANTRELQEMRITVDEKLQGTLTQRLGESFALVTQRHEQVHKGLGEMQTLANGVATSRKCCRT